MSIQATERFFGKTACIAIAVVVSYAAFSINGGRSPSEDYANAGSNENTSRPMYGPRPARDFYPAPGGITIAR